MIFLVTGAAGFLGSNLSASLLNSGNEVIGLDDLSTGSHENVSYLKKYPKFTFFEHDVRETFSFSVDFILNFACPASPVHYQSNPVKTIETNVLGMRNALILARKLNIPILQASTSEIYGDPTISPQHEEYWGNVNPIGIRSCYDEGKRLAETMCFDYRKQYGVDVRVIRIFNTYGPRMAIGDGRVVSNFVVQALQGNPITLYGEGLQTRSFCYVDDLMRAINRVIELESLAYPVNLGNPEVLTMKQLGEIVISLTNSNSKFKYLEMPLDDPKHRLPDISRAKKILAWNPRVGIEEGIKKTITYFSGVI